MLTFTYKTVRKKNAIPLFKNIFSANNETVIYLEHGKLKICSYLQTTPFTRELCEQPAYRSLRLCRIPWSNLSSIASGYLCQSQSFRREIIQQNRAGSRSRNKRSTNHINACPTSPQLVAILRADDSKGIARELVVDPGTVLC